MDVFAAKDKVFLLEKRTYIMGILNVTPDSFSDGGQYFKTEDAVAHALQMEAEGADIIDIGAQSTRPGAVPVTAKEEAERLIPVLTALQGKLRVPVSVDTFFPEVAAKALEAGAAVINDVGGAFQPEIAQAVKACEGGYIVTHAPQNADEVVAYPEGVVPAVRSFFLDVMQKASDCGLGMEHLCLDPGIGFGKSRKDDLELLREMQWLKISPAALLCGASRKRVTTGSDDSPAERDPATLAAHTAAVAGRADFLRVHNVKDSRLAAAMADKLYRV